MDRTQVIAGSVISAVSLFIFFSRAIFPNLFIVDEYSLVLIGISIFPWISIFIKRVVIPGIAEGFLADRKQSTTSKPLPPQPSSKSSRATNFETLSDPSKKILKTLWKYQRQSFAEDLSKRWTFAVFPAAKEYVDYIGGVHELLLKEIISVEPSNYQIMLSNEGIAFCKTHGEIESYPSHYTF